MIGQLLLTTILAVLLIAQVTQAKPPQYIHGGFIADLGQFPYQVSVKRLLIGHTCGGAIIGERHVVSAAHCFFNKPTSGVVVVTGSTSRKKDGQKHPVANIIWHENYSYSDSAPDDIAILVLASPITFDAYQNKIALASEPPKFGVYATIAGWGFTCHEPDKKPAQLQWLMVITMSSDECQRNFNVPLYDTQFCANAGYENGICKGDSGSPVVKDDILIGIVSLSASTKYSDHGSPGILTSVYHYRDWLLNKMDTT